MTGQTQANSLIENNADTVASSSTVESIAMSLTGATLFRGTRPILNGVNISVPAGVVSCIIGPSGAGKTTLLKALNLINPLDEGELRIHGELCFRAKILATRKSAARSSFWRLWDPESNPGIRREYLVSEEAIRRKVGMVFQDYGLFNRLSVLNNLIEAPRHVLGEPPAQATARAFSLLRQLGLEQLAHRKPAGLSGGERQRAAIARALMMNPEILLLDEVTSALDPELIYDVIGMIRSIASTGRTIVMVTHHLALAREISRQIIMMDSGCIIETGTPSQVLDSPRNDRTQSFVKRLASLG